MQKTIIKLKKADINRSIRSQFKLERENKAIKEGMIISEKFSYLWKAYLDFSKVIVKHVICVSKVKKN